MAKENEGAGADGDGKNGQIHFVDYRDESQLEHVDRLVAVDLSEPYSIFTYRYFLNRYPDLCILAVDKKSGEVCGCVVGKIDVEDINNPPMSADMSTSDSYADGKTSATHTAQAGDILDSNNAALRAMAEVVIHTGYIGMLAVSKSYRRRGIGKDLVRRVLQRMKARGCTSVTLETVSLAFMYIQCMKWSMTRNWIHTIRFESECRGITNLIRFCILPLSTYMHFLRMRCNDITGGFECDGPKTLSEPFRFHSRRAPGTILSQLWWCIPVATLDLTLLHHYKHWSYNIVLLKRIIYVSFT